MENDGKGKYDKVSSVMLSKIDTLQKQLTDDMHIEKVNNFIGVAEEYSELHAKNDYDKSRLFHAKMNQLTKRAGLRR